MKRKAKKRLARPTVSFFPPVSSLRSNRSRKRNKRPSCTYVQRFEKSSTDVLSDVTASFVRCLETNQGKLCLYVVSKRKRKLLCPLRATLTSKRSLFYETKIDRRAVAVTWLTRGKQTDLNSGLKEGKLRALYERCSTETLPGFLDVPTKENCSFAPVYRPACPTLTVVRRATALHRAQSGKLSIHGIYGVRLGKPTRKSEEAAGSTGMRRKRETKTSRRNRK